MKPRDNATPASAAAPAIDQATLDKIGEETRSLGRVDRVFHWDRRQGVKVADANGKLVPGPEVIVCGHDRAHGPLVINGAGALLMCGATKGGAACTYNQPVSI